MKTPIVKGKEGRKTMNLTQVFMEGNASWDLGGFLENATTNVQSILGLVISLIGVIMIGVGVFKIAKALISHGKEQTSWVVNIALLIVGGALMIGGWSFVSDIAKGGKDTIMDLGEGDNKGGDAVLPEDYNKSNTILNFVEFD